jgi:hypothetical protein
MDMFLRDPVVIVLFLAFSKYWNYRWFSFCELFDLVLTWYAEKSWREVILYINLNGCITAKLALFIGSDVL